MTKRASFRWAFSLLLLVGAAWSPHRGFASAPDPTYIAPGSTDASTLSSPPSQAYFVGGTEGQAFHTLNAALPASLEPLAYSVSLSSAAARCTFQGANPDTGLVGEVPAAASANVFVGNEQPAWRLSLPVYERVRYTDLYPGIELVYSLPSGRLKSEYALDPGISVEAIRVHCPGVTLTTEDNEQVLVMSDGQSELRETLPAVYQPTPGGRQPVGLGFELLDSHTYSYELRTSLNPAYGLIIDPVFIHGSLIGGGSTDEGWSIAVDSEGSTYISGITNSSNFPATISEGPVSDKDVLVAKFDQTGALAYATIIGGASGEEGNAIAVDAQGNAYVAGETFSRDFPLLNAWQPQFVGYEEAFLLKLDPEGHLAYSTYIGGTRGDEVNDMVADSVGNVYLGGEVYSDDFPLMDPWSGSTYGDVDEDGFITIFNANGEMVYSTYISAPQRDQVFRIAVDASGYVYGTGMTSSPDFPRINALQTEYGGDWDDCFVFKLDPWNNEMIYSTLLGGNGRDECWGIAVDQDGAAYVTGFTSSDDFPTVQPLQAEMAGWDDIFVAKLSPSGDQLLFSTYVGGVGRDRGWDLALDGGGNVYVVGETESAEILTVDALQKRYQGQTDGYMLVLDPQHTVLYASYLGGPEYDRIYGLALEDNWTVHIAGGTASDNFPAVTDATSTAGGTDAFVGLYGLVPTPTPTPTPIPQTAKVVGPEGATLWLEYPGHITVLTVPQGYVSSQAVFTLTYENHSAHQGDLTGVDHFFSFETDLVPQTTSAERLALLPSPLELTLAYGPSAAIEDTISLYRLSAGVWTTDSITVTSRQPQYLRATIDRTGSYGLLGESNRMYLPSLLRQ